MLLLSGCQPDDYHHELNSVARRVNEKCPRMLDSETRIDSLAARGSTLCYYYSLVNLKFSAADTQKLRSMLLPGIIAAVRKSPEMQRIRENRGSLVYLYRDRLGAPLITIAAGPRDYE
jgi:hypothetical protein